MAATTTSPPLPELGEIVYYDYRHRPDDAAGSTSRGAAQPQTADAAANAASSSSSCWRARSQRRAIRLAQFNVERGYELERVIDELRQVDADVIALQEVDVGCERSAKVDVGRSVAQALGLCGFFLCEFHEHHSSLRDARSQGGGAHGNAILSRYDLRHARRVDHQHHPVDWNLPPERQPHALARREPRSGQRAALAVRVFPPWLVGDDELDGLLVYSAHLEVFCGAADRAAQFGDLVADSLREREREVAAADGASSSSSEQQQQQRPWRHAILGDLNTMAHGVARLSPHYAQGPLRWRTLGLTEAEWWERHVLWRRRGTGEDAEEEELVVATRRQRLVKWGVPHQAARALVPNPGFSCPFPARGTITLDNPAYRLPLPAWAAAARVFRGSGGGGRQEEEVVVVVETATTATTATTTATVRSSRRTWIPLMAGKLDWVLLHEKGFVVERAFLGNGAFAASDHAWLAVDAVVR